ncbi:MAG: hypothetical protein GY823_12645, partial [Flavobacteriaceae bacterium]|nr:hypothetical protein [Flavobacteriaceae bacterium]
MKITRNQYMKNSSELHDDYYSQFVTNETIQFISLNIGVDKLRKSKCEHFNDVVRMVQNSWIWDKSPINMKLARDLKEISRNALPSPSTRTCIGKAAARMLLKKTYTTKNQKIKYAKVIKYDGIDCDILVTVRYDDECSNGHNTFAITGDIYKKGCRSDKYNYMGGCIHEEIIKHFPELKHLIKWHLVSSDEPMHYLANTLYHARDRTHEGKEIGEGVTFSTALQFKGFPITFKQKEKGFFNYLDSVGDFNNITVEAVPYDGKDSYSFKDKFSLTGFIKENSDGKWYQCPFDTISEAQQFLKA